MRFRLCVQHRVGREYPVERATFAPTCPKCLSLLAEGKRTGDEPHPSELRKPGEMMRHQETARLAEVNAMLRKRKARAAA